MNEHIASYIAKRKTEIEKEQHDEKASRLKELGIGEREYSDKPNVSKEYPYYDTERSKPYRINPGEFTDEEFEEAMKYAPKKESPNAQKIWLAIYLIWVCIHLILLFWGAKRWEPYNEDFLGINHNVWPFSGDPLKQVYDISEFIVYTIVPLIVYWVIRLFKESHSNK